MKEQKHYAERDAMALGKFYTAHVSAMTRERLFTKSDIAAELAHRDKAISELSEKTQWQPIETAPERKPVLAYFKEPDDNYIAVAAREDSDWWTDTCGELMEANTSPTHWMPLPEPPKEREK